MVDGINVPRSEGIDEGLESTLRVNHECRFGV